MRIALLHPDSPTAEGSGAVHSATLIGESLSSLGHEVVFFCPGSVDENYTSVETYELKIEESILKNKYARINDAITELEDKISSFDVFHSYLMRTIPAVGKISKNNDSIGTVVSLNAYGALCPKNDLLYKNRDDCRSNGALRCGDCVYSSMQELPPKQNRGTIYRNGRIAHHTIKNMKNYPLVVASDKYKDDIDGFQALSEHVKDTYSSFGFSSNRIKVIPNILDDQFRVPHKSKFSSPIRLLYVGGLKKHKGVDRLPYLLKRVNEIDEREFKLSIAGKGPLERDILETAADMGVGEKITVHGFVQYEELPELYATHDLFVYPGRWQEPFGRVFLESLAAGTPVVSTDVGAASEIVGTGGLVKDKIDELIDSICALSQNQLQDHSKQGIEEVEKFEKDTVVAKIERLYEEVS